MSQANPISGGRSRGNPLHLPTAMLCLVLVLYLVSFILPLALLIHQGPLPITNGWFAMFPGIAACPLTASLVRRFVGVRISARAQFMVALLVMIAGRIAVVIVLHRPFLPQLSGTRW